MTGWREVVDRADVSIGKTTDIVSCQRIVADAMAPADAEQIAVWLGELSTITVRRAEGAEEGALAVVAYTKRLRGFPGDIVRDTLQNWTGKWWPSWGELKDILDARTAPRRKIQDALAAEFGAQLTGTADHRIPKAVANLRPEDKAGWYRWEASRAARTDPDWAKELNLAAEEIEDELRRQRATEKKGD